MLGTEHAKLTLKPRGLRTGPVWVALVFLLLSGAAPALGDSIRIGYVDMKRLFDSAPQVVAAREALDIEFRPRNQALIDDETRLEQMQRTLADGEGLPADQRFELEQDIRNLRRSVDRRRQDLREELRFRTSTATKALEETIEVAVRQVAEERGYDLILTSPVAFAAPGIDITDQILDWLADDFSQRNNAP
ncbi:MAG: OmpH family outer membrane protein [Wenzhouxiangella sp.]